MNLVSIVMPAFNAEKYIEASIQSVINQSFKSRELIVVNDGSTDSTRHLVEKYCANDDRVILINQENKVTNPWFFIFSDDLNWVKENFIFDTPHTFVEGNDDAHSYEDMRLMSNCKHNIIANSSFSWWGDWLNKNDQKCVIAPRKWYSNYEMNNAAINLVPPNRIRL